MYKQEFSTPTACGQNMPDACPPSPVAEAFMQLDEEYEHLQALLDSLGGRLEIVLSPPHPDTEKSDPGRPHESQLHGRILGVVNQTRSTAERVERILSRLTL